MRSENDLAAVLRVQDKYEQAEEMHRQAHGLRETVLGKADNRTIVTRFAFKNGRTTTDLVLYSPVSFHGVLWAQFSRI
jgi:hypothetical protein